MSERFRKLAVDCSAVTAAIALCEVQVLLSVADSALSEWRPGDIEGQEQCRSDRAALARVVELLEMHCRAQEGIDRQLSSMGAAREWLRNRQ